MMRRHRFTLPHLFILLLTVLGVWFTSTLPQARSELLTVHVIPHSHCDPGWLNTFEGYYTSEVRIILDGILRELSGHPNRKFVWSEISYFNRWYESLNKDQKEQFKSLVKRGQIEFVNGGWVQSDESAPDPTAIINQLSTGHEYILKNFGVAPRVGWQIDPFGHSAVTPSLWSLMGYEALVINRIHHSIKDSFKSQKKMEFIWRGDDLGQKTDMFTHVLHTHYSAPPGFDWEEASMGIDANNVGHRARDFANIMRGRSQAHRTQHLLVPFGDDFKFKQAERQFSNMDRVIEHINADSASFGMRVRYSTLSDYFEAVSGSHVKHPLIQGDFFPYADNEDSYWTGYYTTRPLLKQKSRKLNHILRACEQLLVLVRSSPHSNLDTTQAELSRGYWEEKFREIEKARMETALFLHHDAITGTGRSHVVNDYQSRMDSASEQAMYIMTRMIEHLLTKEPNPTPNLTPDPLVFGPPEGTETEVVHPVVYYNSLGWVRREVVSIRVASRNVHILAPDGTEIPCQVEPVFDGLANGDLTPNGNVFEVAFQVEVPPLGANTYYVKMTASAEQSSLAHHSIAIVYAPSDRRSRGQSALRSKYVQFELNQADQLWIENGRMKVYFNSNTGLVERVDHKRRADSSETIDFAQTFGKYSTSRSGAYLFRPQSRLETFTANEPATVRIIRGPIRQFALTQFHGFDVTVKLDGSTDLPLESSSDHVQIQSLVHADTNTDLICAFGPPPASSQFPTRDHEFFTNSGLDWQRRQTKQSASEAQNFYPMVVGARMVSNNPFQSTFTIFSPHSMAAGSQRDGSLELLMHRSLAQDDGRGLAEAVNDNSRVEIPLWISFESRMSDLAFRRKSLHLNNPLRVFYKLPSSTHSDAFLRHDHVASPAVWSARQHVSIKPLRHELPPHIHLQSLLVRDTVSDDVVVRFHHLSREAPQWVGSFEEMFDETYDIAEVRRATLTLNTIIPMSGKRTKLFTFTPTDDAPFDPYANLDTSAAGSKGDSQNTNEEGVFISQAALEKLRQDQQRQAQRRLLEQADLEGVDNDVALSPSSSSRHLLSVSSSPSATPLFVIKPLQLHTYVLKLSGSDWAEATRGVHIGIGATEAKDGSSNGEAPIQAKNGNVDSEGWLWHRKENKGDEKHPLWTPNPKAIRVEPVPDTVSNPGDVANVNGVDRNGAARPDYGHRPSASSQANAANVLHGHEHTVLPGRSRDAWRMIPSRGEYILILLASLVGVAFFMQALRVLTRGNERGSMAVEFAKKGKKGVL